MTEQEFRQKYPHSTDEQVRLYAEAVAAEAAGVKPIVEPDIPMPMIKVSSPSAPVPNPVYPSWMNADDMITTYTVPANTFQIRNFSLDDAPPEVPSVATSDEMRDILLGPFNAHLSPDQRQRFQATDMSADEMLAHFFDPKQPAQGVGV